MTFAAYSNPEADDRLDLKEPREKYDVRKQQFRMKPREPREPRAPDGKLKAICERGAWFCKTCCRFTLQSEIGDFNGHPLCECGKPYKWIAPI